MAIGIYRGTTVTSSVPVSGLPRVAQIGQQGVRIVILHCVQGHGSFTDRIAQLFSSSGWAYADATSNASAPSEASMT